MKGRRAIVFEIERFATHDGPGIRTVVFLKGCPLRCMWCHSPESWNSSIETYPDGTIIGREMSSDEVLSEVIEDKDFYDVSGGGMTISGGEPMFRWEFVEEVFRKAKTNGIGTAIETSGYAPLAAIEEVASVTDLWLYDIKGMDAAKHREHVGVDNYAILNNLRWLDTYGANIVLRCPMIPGVNDFDENIVALGNLASELKHVDHIDVEPYIPYGIEKAHKLGLKVYEAPLPPEGYADEMVRKLSGVTSVPVRRG